MYCTACNLEYSEELKYCRNCGQSLVRALGEAVTESLCCTRCGARMGRGEKSCQLCGAKTGALGQETVTGSCHNCGTYWRSSWLFCKRCGLDRDRALQLTAVPSSKTAASASRLREILPEVANLQCAYCGAQTPPHSHFCENCGMRLTRPANGSAAAAVSVSTPSVDPLSATVEEEPLISIKDLAGATVVNLEQPSKRVTPSEPVPPVEPELEHRTNPLAGAEPERLVDKKRVTTPFPPPPGGDAGQQLRSLRQSLGAEQTTQRANATARAIEVDTSPDHSVAETQRIGRRSRWATWMVIFAMALLAFLITAVWRSTSQRRRTPAVVPEPTLATTENVQPSPEPSATLPQIPAGMVFIPGGLFEMGRESGDEYEKPQHFVEVKPFYLDRTEVTNEQYKAFVDATGHPAPAHWQGGQPPAGETNFPVVNVSWDDAVAYAEWAGKRLPTEEEWEFAARGSDGRLYPWGTEWNSEFANTAESGVNQIVEAGRYPGGASPFGVLDLCGNVWEWTSSDLRSYLTQEILVSDLKVIRGGAFDVRNDRATTTYRGAVQADRGYPKTGFRCVREVPEK